MAVMGMICSVKFHQKFHIIPIDNETLITKNFFFYKFLLSPNTTFPMVMHWNEFHEQNKMIEVGQA